MTETLLPPNATTLERALAEVTARVDEAPVPIRELWRADTCPAHLLPWLAWAMSVDEWDSTWPEETKRASIRDAAQIQRHKGTVWAIKRVLANAGYGDARLIEGDGAVLHDESARYNGRRVHGNTESWASYRFNLSRPINRTRARAIRAMLEATAPARCRLLDLSFTDAQFYDGQQRYDGEFAHGVA
ncbi:MAG: phage tail protein I [Lautropia sp.]|nr:phage tail protein I [Lautropia sp.]